MHELILKEGLGDYYRKQDRVAEPLKDRVLSGVDAEACARTQQTIEANGSAVARGYFSVEGMSCMGCVWLIQKLADRRAGVLEVRVSLTENTLAVKWEPGSFELGRLAGELLRFGYRLNPEVRAVEPVRSLSALAVRTLLVLIFTGNAGLLAALNPPPAIVPLFHLLSFVCFVFSVIIGATPFFFSVVRAAQIRRWHSDLGACVGMVAGWAFLFDQVWVDSLTFDEGLAGSSLVVAVFIVSRYLATRIRERGWRRRESI